MGSVMNCPYPGCNGNTSQNSQECPVCHRRVEACSACGQPNRALARQCRACGKAVSANGEWPVYRKDPALDAFSPASLDFDSISPSWPFERLWPSVSLGFGEEVIAPLLAEHGLLVVCTRKSRLCVFNRFTGELLADLKIGERECYAAICGRTLVAGSGSRVVAYDLLAAFRGWSEGRFRLIELWHKELPGGEILQPLNRTGKGANPESLLVWVGSLEKASIYSLDLSTGAERWKTPAVISATTSGPVVDDAGNAYVVADDRKVYRIAFDSGEMHASRPAANPLRADVAPAWVDSTLFFFDEEGALNSCRTDDGLIPVRASDMALFGVRGFATSSRGLLVAHGRGLSKLSLGGQLVWAADGAMTGMGSSPALAGDCGFGITEDGSRLCLCDFKGSTLRFHQLAIVNDRNLAPPAFAGRVIYTCSFHGEVSALRVKTAD